MNALPPDQIAHQLDQLPDWRLEDNWLARDIQFSDFVTAWQFMSYIAQCAEQQDHHPNWYNVYGTVQLRLSSHDAAGVTERDFRLAHCIDDYLANVAHINLPATPIFTP